MSPHSRTHDIRASSSTISLDRQCAVLPQVASSLREYVGHESDRLNDKDGREVDETEDKMRDIPLRTLGDGPVGPAEAIQNAEKAEMKRRANGKDEDMGYVEPGLKGWLNLLGVSTKQSKLLWTKTDTSPRPSSSTPYAVSRRAPTDAVSSC